VCGTACTAVKTDNDNCGKCGTKCGATQTCNGGVCGTAPTAVLPAANGCTALTIVASGGTVYYADEGHGTINKVGGTAALSTGEMAPTWLAMQGANLFWYNKTNKKVRMVPAIGGTAKDVFTNTAGPADGGAAPEVGGFLVSADGATLYVSLGTQVIKVPVATGTPTTVVANEAKNGLPGALSLNGTTNIVFATAGNVDVDAPLLSAMPATCGLEDADSNVIMMPTTACPSCACPRLGRSQGQILMDFMVVINGRAFWVSDTEVRSEMIGATGATYDSTASSEASITAAAATTDTIYFASADPSSATSGVIQKAPAAVNTTNAVPTKLARGQSSPISSIAVDATKVYWAGADCTISSIAK
jgi:hypothetical protein